MDFRFDEQLGAPYRSGAQKIRVMSEGWVENNMFCPCCGNPHITRQRNNQPVADFQCDYCGETFELKSKNGRIGRKISDGAYGTMIERITSRENPGLFILRYSSSLEVLDMSMIPKFFFVPQVIEKRRPLSETARRAGWTGCNIIISEIPVQGRIPLIKNQKMVATDDVVEHYRQIEKMQTNDMKNRSWLLDVLNCVNAIGKERFSLKEVYAFVDTLRQKHPENHNVEAKIRQQLQFLRNQGFIEFMIRGTYRRLI